MRILVGECKQEVSTFNPAPSGYGDFVVLRGDELLRRPRDGQCELDGALEAFAGEPGVEVAPTYSARAITSGGLLPAPDFARIEAEFLGALRTAPAADACYLSLHGAMAAAGCDDPEGRLLAGARGILGEHLPIVVSLDLHGILTDAILTHADAVVVYHTYPHVDMAATGARAARLLLRVARGEVRPVTASVRVPVLARGDELITATGRVGHVIRRAQALEGAPGGLSAGMFWGNPFTDVLDLRSNSLCVTDGDPEAAAAGAEELARLFWEHHPWMRQALLPVDEAVRLTLAAREGTTVLMDAADAPSSGASGDGNTLVRALLEAGYGGTILAPIVDAPAAAAAFAAGVGAAVRVSVGGTLDPARFRPLSLEARVRLLADGRYRGEAWGESYAGPTAVLEAGNLTLVVTSRPVSLHDRGLFHAVGQNPRRFGAVVVKCPHCEPHMYAEWCAQLLNVDGPGATSANLPSLRHTRCARPVFPLDTEVPFEARVSLFRRSGGG